MKALAVLVSFTMACGATSQATGESTTPSSEKERQALRYADTQSAALALFEVLKLESFMAQALEQTIDLRIRENPQLAPLKPTMMKFLNKYMSWEAISGEMTAMYVNAFSHDELEDLITFYETKTGQKSIDLMPALMKQGGETGNRLIEGHMAELEDMLVEAMVKQRADEQPPSPVKGE